MSGSKMVDQGRQDPGRRAGGRGMRLLGMVGRRPELVAPVVQRNIGVWVGLVLIVVIVGLDMVGGGRAELLGLLVGPPIVAASFVGPNRTVGVGVVALGAAVGYGRAVGVDLLAGSQGVPAVAIVAATVLSGLVARVRVGDLGARGGRRRDRWYARQREHLCHVREPDRGGRRGGLDAALLDAAVAALNRSVHGLMP